METKWRQGGDKVETKLTECKTYGGHLFDADISIAGEFLVQILSVDSCRIYNDNIGLHLLEFKNCEK